MILYIGINYNCFNLILQLHLMKMKSMFTSIFYVVKYICANKHFDCKLNLEDVSVYVLISLDCRKAEIIDSNMSFDMLL